LKVFVINHTAGILVSIICVTEVTNLLSKQQFHFCYSYRYFLHATCNCMHGDRIT